jgi:UDP-N-acetylmuramoyl-tripeptide--D-alanyl-D-alanine ligase
MKKKNVKRKRYYGIVVIIFIVIVLFFLINNLIGQQKIENNSDEISEGNLTCKILDKSLELGTQFLLNNQKPEGNFNYEYDWINQVMNPADSEVRQAGALWGIALIYNYNPTKSLREAYEKGFEFFEKNSVEGDDGRKWINYPNFQNSGRTGTVALVTLSIIDFLRSAEDIDKDFHDNLLYDLDKYVKFLLSLRLDNGQFHQSYYVSNGTGYGSPSPYFDGETLLALTKAAKYMDKHELIPMIFESADSTFMAHVIEARIQDPDSSITKGFFQWGCMSFFEIATTDWKNSNNYSHNVMYLTDWMIDVHRTLERTRNTAYAYEGIIHAYEVARINNDSYRIEKYFSVIDEGLYKLTTWQVGGPIPNIFLQNHTTSDKLAIGGIMNHKEEPPLRIDVTQHQMHAVILAQKYVYGC